MSKKKGNLRICGNGHSYFKSSSCPVCPLCEKEQHPDDNFLSFLAAPARRALKNEGILTALLLSEKSETEILKLHGVGPGSLPKLRNALKLKGLSFRQD